MSLHPNDNDILAFWTWFSTISNELGDDLANERLHDELDARIRSLGEIAWEIGPGSTAENALAVSPDGDVDRLPLTQRIVALAPKVPRWEFHPARPARAAGLEFWIATSGGDEITVDARPWRYVLFRFPDNMVDVVIEQGNLADADDEDRYTAAVVLLDALLGERRRLLRVREVEPVVALKPEQAKRAAPITVLPEHLDSLR